MRLGRTPYAALMVLAVACAGVAGCRYPMDQRSTMERASGGVLRVGAISAEPWVRSAEPAPAGVEATLIEEFAEGVDAEIEWRQGDEQALLGALEKHELDVVIGGLVKENPWSQRVYLTRAYYKTPEGERHVMATPKGENALVMALETHLAEHESEARRMLEEAGR